MASLSVASGDEGAVHVEATQELRREREVLRACRGGLVSEPPLARSDITVRADGGAEH